MKILKYINMILFVSLILLTPNTNMLTHAENLLERTEIVEGIELAEDNQLQGIKIERTEMKDDKKEVREGIKDENVIIEEQAISIQKNENVSVDENYKTGAGFGNDIYFVFAGFLSLLIIVALVCWKKLLKIKPFQ